MTEPPPLHDRSLPDSGGVRRPRPARHACGGDPGQAVPPVRGGAVDVRAGCAGGVARRQRAAAGSASGCGDYVSVWVPTGPGRRCARGSARTPPAPSTRRSTSPRAARTSSTRCNLAEAKVLVAHRQLRRPPRRARPAEPRDVVDRRRRRRRPSCRGDRHARRAARRRPATSGRACPAARALGRPQPHLHVGHDRPVEGRPRRVRRVLELRELLHPPVRRPRTTAT